MTSPMLKTIKFRLAMLALAIVVLGGLIGWAAYTSWHEVGKLQQYFSTGHLKSFEIADHVQATILQLNNSLVAYELQHDPAPMDEFLKTSVKLNEWIDK